MKSPIGRGPITYSERGRVALRRQWVITRRDDRPSPNWPSIAIADQWILYHHSDAHVSRYERFDGTNLIIIGIGLIAEQPADGDYPRLLDRFLQSTPIEDLLLELSGTYTLLHHDARSATLYGDPAGMAATYVGFDRIASTPQLLGPLRRKDDLDRRFPFGRDNDWYPGTLTPFHGVTATPANHSLDLETRTTIRHWPVSAPEPRPSIDVVPDLADLLAGLAGSLVSQREVVCSLTGGQDSRVSLAALGSAQKNVRYFTLRSKGTKSCDLAIPAEISERLGLDYRVVDVDDPPHWLLDLYDDMTAGLSVGTRREIVAGANEMADRDNVHLNGNLGALAKGFFWHVPHPRRVSRRALLKEFSHRPMEVRSEVDGWLETLPSLPAHVVYNLMYLEQRGGRWMSPGEVSAWLFYESVTIFSSRRVFELICSVPLADQRRGRLLERLSIELCPELAGIPYCPNHRQLSAYVPRRLKNAVKWTLGWAAARRSRA